EHLGFVPARRRLRRQDSPRSEAGEHPGGAAHQIRARRESDCRESARPRHPADPACPRRRGDRMRRRDFITLIGGAAAWPIVARAQQPERMRRIGLLMNTGADEPESQARLAAFLQGLQELGWATGRNLRIDYRWSPGDLAHLRRDATELVALRPEVVLAGVGPTTPVLQQVTRTLPIVMAQGIDPVGNGYVDTLARPSGNTTGFIQFEYSLAGKWMELLKEVAPGTMRVGVLREPGTPSAAI